MLLMLEMVLRMSMGIHFTMPSGSVRIARGNPIVGMAVLVVNHGSRISLVIVVLMHLGVHAIGMISVLHGRLTTTVVHVVIVRWELVLLVRVASIPLVLHGRRAGMVAMLLLLTSHFVILSNMRNSRRLSGTVLVLRLVLLLWLLLGLLLRPTMFVRGTIVHTGGVACGFTTIGRRHVGDTGHASERLRRRDCDGYTRRHGTLHLLGVRL
jgi:hypothetical protein